jgi:hypothetical protein
VLTTNKHVLFENEFIFFIVPFGKYTLQRLYSINVISGKFGIKTSEIACQKCSYIDELPKKECTSSDVLPNVLHFQVRIVMLFQESRIISLSYSKTFHWKMTFSHMHYHELVVANRSFLKWRNQHIQEEKHRHTRAQNGIFTHALPRACSDGSIVQKWRNQRIQAERHGHAHTQTK